MKHLIKIFVIIFIFSSCSKDEEQNIEKKPNSLGEYKNIIKIQSDIPIDLNEDGIPTTNLRVELKDYFDEIQLINRPYFEIFAFTGFNKKALIHLYFPKTVVYPEYNDFEIKYIDGYAPYSIFYNENLSNINLIKTEYSNEFLLNNKKVIIDNITIKDNNEIEIKLKQQFYVLNTGWVILNITMIVAR